MWILILLIVILLSALVYFSFKYFHVKYENMSNGLIPICVYSHAPSGLNYPWLDNLHGGVSKIQFEEPVGSGIWRDYTDKIWKTHCTVVSHTPGKLADDHIRAFIDPETRFARLRFYFRDGTVMEPTREFYEMEEAWFKQHVVPNNQ